MCMHLYSSICPSVYIYPSVYLFMYLSVLYTYLPIYLLLCVCVSVTWAPHVLAFEGVCFYYISKPISLAFPSFSLSSLLGLPALPPAPCLPAPLAFSPFFALPASTSSVPAPSCLLSQPASPAYPWFLPDNLGERFRHVAASLHYRSRRGNEMDPDFPWPHPLSFQGTGTRVCNFIDVYMNWCIYVRMDECRDFFRVVREVE